MLPKLLPAACFQSPLAAALVASLLVLAAPLRAEVVVERVGSDAAAAIVEGDVLVGWETVGTEPTRSGTFQSWSDAELLDLEATPLGPLRVRLRREGELLSVELPPRELDIDARPGSCWGRRPPRRRPPAQMDLIRGPVETVRKGRTVSLRLDSPRYWAPFVLLGAAR